MTARGFCLLGAALACLALAACNKRAPEPLTVAEALDVCADGRGAFAEHVCADRDLAALDNAVRETLVAESASVSEAGAQLLVLNQNRWREAQRISCGMIDPAAAPSPAQQGCLESEFRARAQDARSAVQEMGGYVFQRMELVDAVPVGAAIAEATGRDDAAVVRDIRFPRIDGPQTPEIRRFNELAAQQPQSRLQDATNETVDYVIAFAGPDIISVRFVISQDQLGAANSTNTVKGVTVLMREGRALTEGDVFRANSGWQRFISRRAIQVIARQFSDYADFPPERDVYETATKSHLWLITEGGLVLLFPPLSFGGSHADGGTEVTITWADLAPYLNPAAPAPIRPAA
jgi:hypothetical protein